MQVHPEYDFLLSAASTRELHEQHTHAKPEQIAQVRAALHEDSRVDVRRNAVVALTAALAERGISDYIPALDDPAPEVASEAASALALYGPVYLSRPENTSAMEALRAHGVLLRELLSARSETVRYNAAMALRVIVDAQVDLSILLGDDSPLVRREGLALAAVRKLGPAEVKALGDLAHKDADPQLRIQAVNLVAYSAPDLAPQLLLPAFERGDVDDATANAVEDRKLTAMIPAIIAYIKKQPKAVRWLQTLVVFKATCASQVIGTLLSDYTAGYPAQQALRSLSGHSEWSAAQLAAWAEKQPGDVAPCVASKVPSPKRLAASVC